MNPIVKSTRSYESWLSGHITLPARRPEAEAHADEVGAVSLPARHLLPLGRAVAGGLQGSRLGAGGARGRRPARREFRHLARCGWTADLGHQRLRRSLLAALHERPDAAGGQRQHGHRRATHLTLDRKDACAAVLEGYNKALEAGGLPFVLAEAASGAAGDGPPSPAEAGGILGKARQAWRRSKARSPAARARRSSACCPGPTCRICIVHRVAGLGSLGRHRFVGIAELERRKDRPRGQSRWRRRPACWAKDR